MYSCLSYNTFFLCKYLLYLYFYLCYNKLIVSVKIQSCKSNYREVFFMIHNLKKRYVLDISTGICHDLDHIRKNCQLKELKSHHIFNADSLDEEIKRHPAYKIKCKYCMPHHDYD